MLLLPGDAEVDAEDQPSTKHTEDVDNTDIDVTLNESPTKRKKKKKARDHNLDVSELSSFNVSQSVESVDGHSKKKKKHKRRHSEVETTEIDDPEDSIALDHTITADDTDVGSASPKKKHKKKKRAKD